MPNRKLLTITACILTTAFGIWISEKTDLIWLLPILFGITIPAVNWGNMGKWRLLKIGLYGLIALVVFIVAGDTSVGASEAGHNILAIFISGITGLVLLFLYAVSIKSLRPNIWTYFLTFGLTSIAIPLAEYTTRILRINPNDDEWDLLLWVGLFAVALSTGLRRNTPHNNI